MKTCKAFEKSNAPMFVCFSAHPNYFEPSSYALTKEEAKEFIKPERFSMNSLVDGDMLCAVIPLGFFHGDKDNKTVYDPTVTMEDMINLMKVQSEIGEGNFPKFDVSDLKKIHYE